LLRSVQISADLGNRFRDFIIERFRCAASLALPPGVVNFTRGTANTAEIDHAAPSFQRGQRLSMPTSA
jgi:hypothetical protein